MNQRHRSFLKLALLIVIVTALLGCILHKRNAVPHDASKWQAVFLTDGQVYFGKLSDYNGRFILLDRVYYLKFSEGLQQLTATGEASPQLNLIKLGGEAHGPEGQMYIAKDKILFVENLKSDSAVVKAIASSH